jgi:hypothetical protein
MISSSLADVEDSTMTIILQVIVAEREPTGRICLAEKVARE